jgi:endonuclease YncB( thermonuclease family)
MALVFAAQELAKKEHDGIWDHKYNELRKEQGIE